MACVAQPKTPNQPPRQLDTSADEYAVYSAVIARMFAGDKVTFDSQTKVKLLVIQDTTVTDSTASEAENNEQSFKKMFPVLKEGVAADYKTKNSTPLHLKDSFELKLKHVLVEKQAIDKMFEEGGGWWEEFYKKYPDSGGFISFSRVGFNSDVDQALVYIAHGCGGLCGTGHYVLLEKGVDGWKVVKRSMVWIS
jgi:hypothetical protein